MIAKAQPFDGVAGGSNTVPSMPPKRSAAVNVDDWNENVNNSLEEEMPVSLSVLSRNLMLFTALKTIGSFDSGAFSAALGAENGISEEWGLSTVQQGTLTSSVFLGNIIGCPLSGNLFSRYSAKTVLTWSLIFHTIFTFFFATLTEYRTALLCRFFIGVTLSFTIVYTPVWVDEFAPRDRQSMWMASHNAGVPLGIMIGYSLGAFLPSYTNVNWEWAFYVKCILTVPAVANLMRVDRRSIDRRMKARHNQTEAMMISASERHSTSGRIFVVLRTNLLYIWRVCVPLFHNIEYMCSTLAMCSLYFVVTGLQNFVTQYLRDEPFRASMKTIMLGFGAAVVTAPVFGVITGGILLDRIGGYHRNLFRVTVFTCAWGSVAAFFSILCIFITDTMTFLIVISIVLFCGGAIIPPGSGTVMSSVPERLRPAGAALSQMMFNLFGNFSGPMLCGFVADITGELRYGIYTLLSCSVVGLVPMFLLLYKVHHLRSVSPQDLSPIIESVAVDAHHTAHTAPFSAGYAVENTENTLPPHRPTRVSISSVSPSHRSFIATRPPSSVCSAEEEGDRDGDRDRDGPQHRERQRITVESVQFPLAATPMPTPRSTENMESLQQTPASSAQRQDMEDSVSAEDILEFEAEAAQMMLFPSQHNFGLDMLRSWLSSSRHSRSVVSPSNSTTAVGAAGEQQLRTSETNGTDDLEMRPEFH